MEVNMKTYTREELIDKARYTQQNIKSLLKERGISYSVINKKHTNIELLLQWQTTQEQTPPMQLATGSKSAFNRLYNQLQKANLVTPKGVRISELIMYEGMSVTETQTEIFSIAKELELYTGVALIANNNGEVIAKGHLDERKDQYIVILPSQSIDYDKFKHQTKFSLIVFGSDAQKALTKQEQDMHSSTYTTYKIPCQCKFKSIEQTDKPLCIDLGTTNTTLGSFGLKNPNTNDTELVSFTDYTLPNCPESYIYPTLIYVKDCSTEKIEYLFGYEAKKKVVEQDYDTEATTYFEIKRWINSLDEIEEVIDEIGNTRKIIRRDILKAYIEHIITMAQEYFKVKFKEIHFSAPIKLKEHFIHEMKSMLPQYKITDSSISLDEGISIVYNHILTEAQKSGKSEHKTNIMIIDCGGGTTDVASCEYEFKKLSTGYNLNITTTFENGDSNFGGNNLTHRIFQLLKIKLASDYDSNIISDIDKLLPNENAMLSMIDEATTYTGLSDIYQALEYNYSLAEKIFPTKFEETTIYQFTSDQRKIKRNFYYLWQLAERIKVEFHRKTDLLSINFIENHLDSQNITADGGQDFYLYKFDGEELVKTTTTPQTRINVNEIKRLLYSDIYNLLEHLLGDIEVNKYNNYKLSGQSCKITLFNQLLKEFVPGKKLRNLDHYLHSEKLKLDCINGSIAYIRDKHTGRIVPKIKMEKPNLIYNIKVNRGDDTNEMFSNNGTQIEVFSDSASCANLEIYDLQGKLEQKISYNLQQDSKEKTTLKDLEDSMAKHTIWANKELKAIVQQIKSVSNHSDEQEACYIIFALPAKDNYGFYIFNVIKDMGPGSNEYYTHKPSYYNFEANISSEEFFNGLR